MFKKNAVQAMVEFANVEDAVRAKDNLQGCDIYSGCCTLKITFARANVTKLNVFRNDHETWDYTTDLPGGPGGGAPGGERKTLLGGGPGWLGFE